MKTLTKAWLTTAEEDLFAADHLRGQRTPQAVRLDASAARAFLEALRTEHDVAATRRDIGWLWARLSDDGHIRPSDEQTRAVSELIRLNQAAAGPTEERPEAPIHHMPPSDGQISRRGAAVVSDVVRAALRLEPEENFPVTYLGMTRRFLQNAEEVEAMPGRAKDAASLYVLTGGQALRAMLALAGMHPTDRDNYPAQWDLIQSSRQVTAPVRQMRQVAEGLVKAEEAVKREEAGGPAVTVSEVRSVKRNVQLLVQAAALSIEPQPAPEPEEDRAPAP